MCVSLSVLETVCVSESVLQTAVGDNVSPADARKIITLGISLSDKNLIILYLSTILEFRLFETP